MIWRDCPDTEIYGLQKILYLEDIKVKQQSETDLDTESPVEVDRRKGLAK